MTKQEFWKVIAFQSTLPKRGVTRRSDISCRPNQFQSTLPKRGVTATKTAPTVWGPISIHTPQAGSDEKLTAQVTELTVSIHTPQAGSDCVGIFCSIIIGLFQSTLPKRGVTENCPDDVKRAWFQSTLPKRGVTASRGERVNLQTVSIHTPQAGSDALQILSSS